MDGGARPIKPTVYLIMTGVLALLLSHKTMWAFGLLVGATWSMANLLFTVNILKISVLQKDPAKLSALILLKFPALYLVGFFIISSKLFPAASLLTGLTAVLLIAGISELWLKRA